MRPLLIAIAGVAACDEPEDACDAAGPPSAWVWPAGGEEAIAGDVEVALAAESPAGAAIVAGVVLVGDDAAVPAKYADQVWTATLDFGLLAHNADDAGVVTVAAEVEDACGNVGEAESFALGVCGLGPQPPCPMPEK